MSANLNPSARILCLLGTSRPDGDTRHLVQQVMQSLDDTQIVDTGSFDIGPYDYEHRHDGDDFSKIVPLIDAARVLIFATPVYWYSMSAQLKTVFDRLTDLTETYKAVGKRLGGKSAFAIINGGPLPEGFTVPFSETARYFGMKWGGLFNEPVTKGAELDINAQTRLNSFIQSISNAAQD